jgi:hypothetical protein
VQPGGKVFDDLCYFVYELYDELLELMLELEMEMEDGCY